MTTDEKHQMLMEWNHTPADFSEQLCIHQLFEAQVEQTPDAVAVVCGQEQLTYWHPGYRLSAAMYSRKYQNGLWGFDENAVHSYAVTTGGAATPVPFDMSKAATIPSIGALITLRAMRKARKSAN